MNDDKNNRDAWSPLSVFDTHNYNEDNASLEWVLEVAKAFVVTVVFVAQHVWGNDSAKVVTLVLLIMLAVILDPGVNPFS